MTKGVQLWPGNSMRTFYRRHIARETALDAEARERLVEALTKATNRMLVWEMPDEAKAASPTADKKGAGKSKAGEAKLAAPTQKPAASEPEKPFDPYAFSAMVVLAKQGKDALAKRLAEIKTLEHLRQFADVQHLGFDRSLTRIDDVRKALVAAAEQRLADRRAAAS